MTTDTRDTAVQALVRQVAFDTRPGAAEQAVVMLHGLGISFDRLAELVLARFALDAEPPADPRELRLLVHGQDDWVLQDAAGQAIADSRAEGSPRIQAATGMLVAVLLEPDT